MLKKTISYVDFDGNERKEDHYFNLTKTELTEMEVGVVGGMSARLEKVIADKDAPLLMSTFKDIVGKSYGIKSEDGKRFKKSPEITREFFETLAYDTLFQELCSDADKAAYFFRAILPATEKPAMTAPAN